MKSITQLISLEGKTAIITGAASGIGKATAIRFGEAGASLYIIDIDEKGLKETKKTITKIKPDAKIETIVLDLSNKEEIDKFWETLEETPDILANIAGIYPFKQFTTIDENFLKKVFEINYFSTFWMSQWMVKKLLAKKKGGVIINTGSIEAFLPFENNLAHYTSTKAAIIALTRAIAKEYGKQGIRANVIVPGGIKTPGTMKVAAKLGPKAISKAKEFTKRVPLGRFGEPDEVATAYLFLASDLAKYVTGAVLFVDGGFTST